ncbi:MAG TPA: T9SS type A sorting domain-containing protein, partial [Salinivirgaceae bacterium]|nr:T9SS type A sorting domain-containing protein [Salinivirgaceae bacterium]
PSSTVIKTSLIYPQSALELAQFYTNVCSVYLPEFLVEPGFLIGGSSDHASFNNNGYMGIFPFEDVDNHSPYIHTANDTIGLSYNNELMATIFTKATLASVATMSNMRFPPKNLVALPSDNVVELFWDYVVDISCYKVYRNGTLYDSVTTNYFADFDVVNGRLYQYYVTAVFSDTNKESGKSNTVTVKPTVPMVPPVVYDFEGGVAGWNFEGEWGLTTSSYYSPSNSLTESPNGNYGNNLNASATFGPIGLMGYTSAQFKFWTKYDIETNYDNVYLEISVNGAQWTKIEQFTGTQATWMQKSYLLNDYLNKSIYIRFRFMSDASANKDGIYIDDFEISVTGNGQMQPIKLYSGWNGVSTFLTPISSDIEDITQSITTNLVVIQDETDSYQPSTGINTLGNWNTNSGYKIKVSNNTYFRIAGNKIEDRSVNLNRGWNIMPIISECNVFCDDFFANIPSIVVIKEIGSSGVYWFSKNIATLYYLQPGKAYYVYASEDVTITFPDCEGDKTVTYYNGTTSYPWEVEKPSGNSHIIGISKEALQDFSVGDKIGVFNTHGKCAGAITIGSLNYNTALVAFAKDTMDINSNGFVDGELLKYRIYKTSTNLTYDYSAEYSFDMPDSSKFNSEGISFVTKFNEGDINVLSVDYKVSIYPNPIKEYLFVELPNENQALVEIISVSGQIVQTEIIRGKAQIEVSSLSKGVYFLKIMNQDQVIVEKIIVQ